MLQRLQINTGLIALVGLFLLGHFLLGYQADNIWVFEDDPIRINMTQFVMMGYMPHFFGIGWLPLTTYFHALFFLLFPFLSPIFTALLANVLCNIALLALLLAMTTRIVGLAPAFFAMAAVLLAPAFLQLNRSALSEPSWLLLIIGGVALLVRGEGRTSRLYMGTALLVLSQVSRYESWMLLPCTVGTMAVTAYVLKNRRLSMHLAACALILCVFPAIWTLVSWIREGSPHKWLMEIKDLHRAHHAALTVGGRLMRLVECLPRVPILLLPLAIFGAVRFPWREHWLAGGLFASLFVYSTGFLVYTAIDGSYAYVPLDRFVLVPFVFLVPLAAVALREATRFAAMGVVGAVFLAILASQSTLQPYDYDAIRERTRLNLARNLAVYLDTLDESDPRLVVQFVPEDGVDVLVNTMRAVAPESNMEQVKIEPGWTQIHGELSGMPDSPTIVLFNFGIWEKLDNPAGGLTGYQYLGLVDRNHLFSRKP